MLMLVPETIEVLGGLVEQLDAARKRLVDELNKPARGKRYKLVIPIGLFRLIWQGNLYFNREAKFVQISSCFYLSCWLASTTIVCDFTVYR
jgi:hypothetical protein